ncbi:MAG TPA: cohesin domain-containing protein [Methylomirabilota bacterium]|nr:cohesin domain-containing protein [Methylomirabilota bacterium]
MSKKFILALILFLFLVIALAATLLTNTITLPRPLFAHSKIQTQNTKSSTTLLFSPNQFTLSAGQPNTVHIILTSTETKNLPHIIQLEIAYDPNALGDVAIQPGEYATHPTLLLSNIDTTTGRISYALEANNQPIYKKTGTVATLRFTPVNNFWQHETTLSFLPKTMIRGTNGLNISTKLTETKLLFPQVIPNASSEAVLLH